MMRNVLPWSWIGTLSMMSSVTYLCQTYPVFVKGSTNRK